MDEICIDEWVLLKHLKHLDALAFEPIFHNSKEMFSCNTFFQERTTTAVTVITFITKIYFTLDFLTQGFISFATQMELTIANIFNRIYHVTLDRFPKRSARCQDV